MKAKELILSFIKRYKIETISVLIVSLIAAGIFDDYTKFSTQIEITIVLMFIAMGSFLVDKIYSIYDELIKRIIYKIKNKIKFINLEPDKLFDLSKVILYIVAVLIQYLLYKLSLNIVILNADNNYKIDINEEGMFICAFLVGVIITSLISYFIIKEKKINLKNYLLKIFNNFLLLFLTECVVLVGILVLYLICEVLLDGVPYYIISKIIVFVISVISLMGFFVCIENVNKEYNLFLKILVRYIMQIMVLIGFAIFYLYLVKIILKLELPSNEVFVVCTALFSIGLLISLMSLGMSEDNIYNKIIKYLPIAFIPVLILQIISIGLRVSQYGFTASRYIGIVIIIFEVIYITYYIMGEICDNKKVRIEKLLLYFCILILISFFVPKINVYEFPMIYNSIFKKNVVEKVTNKSNIKSPKMIYLSKDYDDKKEIDIAGYSKMSKYEIRLELDNTTNTIIYRDVDTNKEYDKSVIDFTEVVNKISYNISSDNLKTKNMNNNSVSINRDIVFDGLNNIIITNDNKMIINYIYLKYNVDAEEIVKIEIQGILLKK